MMLNSFFKEALKYSKRRNKIIRPLIRFVLIKEALQAQEIAEKLKEFGYLAQLGSLTKTLYSMAGRGSVFVKKLNGKTYFYRV